ncbi:MAG: hypothetical protein DRJ37_00175 [Thermoprotei archaeon]|nr:MAG: hypothetical protein DRJ37_00175 [Thermoprotei archaeon]
MYEYFSNLRVPRVLIGTSPFIAGGQFGLRAWEYYRRFVGKSEEVAEIIEYCVDLGVKGVQVLAYDYIVEAVKKAMDKTGIDLFVVGTLIPEDPQESLKLLIDINCRIGLVHGMLTTPRSLREVGRHLRLIEEADIIPGVALHNISALEAILKEYPQIEVVMAPVNIEGIFMNNKEKSLELLEKSGRFIIAKKVLGAGRIEPERALKYVFSLSFVKSVAIGVASRKEAEETFTIAWRILGVKGDISRDLSGTE